MKDFGSDKKALSFDEYDSQSPKIIQSPPNADIDYLLSYITLNVNQQLNLTQNSFKQQSDPQTISTETLRKYITRNSNTQTAQPFQRETLVSIIDSGMSLISRIKNVMHKRRVDEQKNKTLVNEFDMFKELFFGGHPSREQNEYGGQEFEKKKSTDILMKQLRLKSQVEMLLAKIRQGKENVQNGLSIGKYHFLLTKSLQQKIDQRVGQKEQRQQIGNKIKQLDQLLTHLQEYSEKHNLTSMHEKEYEKRLTQVWTHLQLISQNF